ncbi:MAG: hypothetical protein SAL70_30205 [Scytonema sp. PMC 1070.18]|nr:hypothetical protein [Scytonema sp. PMC 1070.18]
MVSDTTVRDFQVKKYPTLSCGAGWVPATCIGRAGTPATCIGRAGTPVPQDRLFISWTSLHS